MTGGEDSAVAGVGEVLYGGGGATPARERRRGLAGEVQGGERNPFRGSIGAEEGRRVWFHGEPSLPAAMAWAAFLRASREGDGPFYRRAMEGRRVWASWKAVYWGRRGRGGRSQARGAAAILVARAGEERGRGELRGAREGGLGQYQGRGSGLELGRDAWEARWRLRRRTAPP